MKTFSFPFYVSFGKLDNVSSSIEIALTESDAKRLEQSAQQGGRVRLNEDEEIQDIFDRVYESILSHEKEMLMLDSTPVADAFSWKDSFDPTSCITEKQIDEYLDDLVIGINFPEELQLLERTISETVIQTILETAIVERNCIEEYLSNIDNLCKVVLVDQGETLFFVPKSFSGTFTIPSSVKSLEKGVFKNHSNISEIIFEDGIDEIPDWTFDGCKGLVKVMVSSTVKKIGFNAFTNCTSLKEVVLENGVEAIDSTAFRFCSKLEVLHIPASVKEISCYINNYYNGLKHLYFEGTETTITDIHAYDRRRLTIHVLKGSTAEKCARKNNLKYVLMVDE